MRRSLLLVALACALPAVGCAQAIQTPAASGPTLLVFLTVDQLRPDYFMRFEGQLSGGLARLYRGGAFYTNAFHDHAITETAPGHASTMSGRFPRSTGIVENSAGVGDLNSPLIGGGGPGASPHRFRGTVLIDWILQKNPQARALSVSRKDRGAILPMGRAKLPVFWYAGTGNFTTSSYYTDTLPEWVRQFNARRVPAQSAGKAWTLLLEESQYPEADDVPQENAGRGGVTFPHLAPTDSARARSRTRSTRATPGTLFMASTNARMTESGDNRFLERADLFTRSNGVSQMNCVVSPKAAATRVSIVQAVSSAARAYPAFVFGSRDLTPGYGATPWSAVRATITRDESRTLYSESKNAPRYRSSRRT